MKVSRFVTRSNSWIPIFAITIASIAIASWLMLSTFSYDPSENEILITSKVWSDFGAHIPMIRSFSLGDNLTQMIQGKMPEYPLFPGAPITYHFLFYMWVGVLEKLGVRIDWALNSFSIIGFAGMLIALYCVAKKLFNDWRVGVLTWLFTLFNGSLTFVEYFKSHGISIRSLNELFHLDEFVSFAPWKNGDISAFWSLNIFTNQRHLGFSFMIFFLFLYTLIKLDNSHSKIPALPAGLSAQAGRQNQKSKISIFALLPWAVIIGFLPFFHQPTFVMIAIACLWYFIVFSKLRIPLLGMGIVTSLYAIPQLVFLSQGQSNFAVSIGYIMEKPITLWSAILYWWHNIGGHLLLIPLGFFLSPKRVKKYLFPAFLYFVIGVCFQFSRELAANHKFFNLFLIMGSMFTAQAIMTLFDHVSHIKSLILRIPVYIVPFGLILFLTFSGVVDAIPIIHDGTMRISDIKANKNAEWFLLNTPPDSVILNSSFFFHPASLAGRKIFLGWPYFAWSAGYDTVKRLEEDVQNGYNPDSLDSLCELVRINNISYVTFEDGHMEETEFNETIYRTSVPLVYTSEDNSFRIYDVRDTCSLTH